MTSEEPGASFGDLLRRFRAGAGISQDALSARSGISVDAISMLERGARSSPRNSTVGRLADALRLGPADRAALVGAAQRHASAAPAARARPAPTPATPAPVGGFVGRAAELAELRHLLRRAGRVAVHGPGGAGKTQLAARYAADRAADYPDGVFWLRAGRVTTLVEDLAGLAWRLGLGERHDARLERPVEAVSRWLRGHGRWLLVLDDLTPAAAEAARRWLPPGLLGHLVETSRVPLWTTALAVGPLPLDDAERLLRERAGEAAGGVAGMVAELAGRLPLALELAAAHVAAVGGDLAGVAAGLPGAAAGPVEAFLRASLLRLEAEQPAVPALCRLLAFLGPHDVPLSLLRPGAGPPPEEPGAELADAAELDRAVATARRCALVERTGDGLGMHPAIQEAVRRSLSADRRDAWLAAAVRLLRARFPDEAGAHPDRWPLCARLLPHVDAVDELVGDGTVEPLALSWLLDRAAACLHARGQNDLARPRLERALAIRERELDADHPDTAESLDHLALLLHEDGELGSAGRVLRRALTRALGASALSPPLRDALADGIAALFDADVDRTYPTRTEALPDIRHDLRSAADVRLLASRGNELQRETFEQLLFKRSDDRDVVFRVLLPATGGGDGDTYWMRVRESEMGRFDPSFRPGMLATQVDVNVRFLMPYVEIGTVDLRRFNVPHLGRLLLTESVCYLTMYRSDAHGRDSRVVKFRRGATYDWLSRLFEMVWESASETAPPP